MHLTGKCLCGAVKFEAQSDGEGADRCHCKMCRRWGGVYDSVFVPSETVRIEAGEDLIKWYESSDFARRGFCSNCGSNLFYHADRHKDFSHLYAVSVGTLDEPTNLRVKKHYFCASKGDYYEIEDRLEKLDTY